MPPAIAGAAVIAMRAAASSLSITMVSIDRLYEHSFYLRFYHDEPTAALDGKVEARAFAEAGRVAESGAHQEPMEAGGLYRELFTIQARAYAADGLCGGCGTARSPG